MALTTNERLTSEHWRRRALLLLFRARKSNDANFKGRCNLLARACMAKYATIVFEPADFKLPRPPRLDRTIESFTESECWNFFETRKADLYRLLRAFRLPDKCVLENGTAMSGEEVMLRALYELVSGEDQYTIAQNVFGRDQSDQSRAYKYFVDLIYAQHNYLVTDNLEWWFENGFIEESRQAITKKLAELGLLYRNPETDQEVAGFIDCNCMETARVGGGPIGEGPDAERWIDLIQRAFYNGWKSVHGLKHQTIDSAHGLTMHMYGPTSLRRNDLRLLSKSELNDKLAALCMQYNQICRVYGDSIYPHLSNVFSMHRGDWNALSLAKRLENNIRKSVRVSIEWNYGVTSNLYGYMKNLNKLRLLGNSNVSKIYTVATLLRNCHITLYGGISSGYFNIKMPEDMLERYMRVVH